MNLKSPSELIGRALQLAELRNSSNMANQGEGRLVLIRGEAGAGKSRLISEALAESELRVFTARCRPHAAPPFQPLVELLRAALRADATEAVRLGRLSDYLNCLLPERGEAPRNIDQATLNEALFASFCALGRSRPTCLVLEDLQWCDNATLELLPQIAQNCRSERLLIIGSYRPEETGSGHPLRRLRAELRRRNFLSELTLEPLSPAETAALAEQLLCRTPAPELAETIYSYTQGTPLFIEALCEHMAERSILSDERGSAVLPPQGRLPLPESILDAVQQRLSALPDEERAALEAAAVAGPEVSLPILDDLLDNGDAVDRLIAQGLLVELDGQRAVFRHNPVREAVLAETAWSNRRRLHRALAELLAAQNAPAEQTAQHFLEAGERAEARKWLLRAAEEACTLHAYRDSTAAAKQALDLWPPEERPEERRAVLKQLAHCAQLGHCLPDAVLALRELIEGLKEQHAAVMGPPEGTHCGEAVEAYRGLATVLWLQGAHEQALAARRDAIRLLEAQGEAEPKALIELAQERAALASGLVFRSRLAEGIRIADEAASDANELSLPALRSLALSTKSFGLAMSGKSSDALPVADEALRLALELDNTEAITTAYRALAYVHGYASNYDSSREAFQSALTFCRERGRSGEAEVCLGCMSFAFFRRGEWKQVREACREVFSGGSAGPAPICIAHGVIGVMHAIRGEQKAARRHLLDCERLLAPCGIAVMEFFIHWGLGLLAEYESEDEAAAEHYRRNLEVWQTLEDRFDVLGSLFPASRFFAARGMAAETHRCAEVAGTISAATNGPEALACLAYTLGEAAMLSEQYGTAAEHFSAAFSRLEEVQLPYEMTLADYRLGAALCAAGRRDEGSRRLLESFRAARRIGARPLAARIAAEAAGLGILLEEPRRADAAERASWSGLTRRQQEVAALIAEGLTNKEIAKKLFVSPRTVDMHVGHILDRLDARTRTEAVQKLAKLGLFG